MLEAVTDLRREHPCDHGDDHGTRFEGARQAASTLAGQLDGAESGPDHSDRAAQQVLEFSTPYLQSPPTIVGRSRTAVSDLATARTLRWEAVGGTTFVEIVKTLITLDTPLRTFDSNAECSTR